MYPESIKNLIDSFRFLPGIGEKTAERLTFCMMDLPEEKAELFVESIQEVRSLIHPCKQCHTLTENEFCSICEDPTRENILCVVEDVKSVFLFEKLGTFHGQYHVLSGLISPIDGINPEDIGIKDLIDRIKMASFEEIILAFKSSVEGETTALYIKKILEGLNLTVSRLASGIPMGADMEYVDALTLERALNDRKKLS